MLDTALPILQRARGRAAVALSRRAGATRLDRLHQSGCAKAFLPRVHTDDPEVVFLNTSGGLTGGDRFEISGALGDGACATLTTQTAERAYCSTGDRASVRVSLTAGAGARLRWLPQETILFDGSVLDRQTTIELAADAELLTVETLVIGRPAMGETVTRLDLTDIRRIERAGTPFLIEPVRLDGATLASSSPASLGEYRALSTLIFAARGAEDALDPVRAVLGLDGTVAAASAWDGRLVVRAMARDGWPLRRLIARVLTTLTGAALPRVWQV